MKGVLILFIWSCIYRFIPKAKWGGALVPPQKKKLFKKYTHTFVVSFLYIFLKPTANYLF